MKEFTAVMTNRGICLCEKQDGAFLVLESADDLKNLKELLNRIVMVEAELGKQHAKEKS